MATRFYLPDGRVTNLVMRSQKLFIARSRNLRFDE
jgi:catalase